jgi:hypothetical protein
MPLNDLLIKDYEIKGNYLSGHHQRMWNRFSIFVTLESALFSGTFIFKNEVGKGQPSTGLAAVGLVVSLIWVLFNLEDLRLLRIHERHVSKAHANVVERADATTKHFLEELLSGWPRPRGL